MNVRTGVVVLAVVVSMVAVGALSFSTATVDRTAEINVENDDVGLIGLTPNTSIDGIAIGGDGQLSLDLDADETSTGLNTNGVFLYGDENAANAQANHAFTITNNAASSKTITLDYELDGASSDNDAGANVEFIVYGDDGTNIVELGRANEEGQSFASSSKIGAGNTVYVVIKVTTNTNAATNDLTGTLTIGAAE